MDEVQGTLDPSVRISSSLEVEVVRAFLRSLQRLDPEAAAGLVSEDFLLTHSGLPTLRGRRAFRHAFGLIASTLSMFEILDLHIAGDGAVVLTERRELFKSGPLEIEIWACGRFEVRSGEIVRLHDHFDWLNVVLAGLRGVVGVFVPPLRAGRRGNAPAAAQP